MYKTFLLIVGIHYNLVYSFFKIINMKKQLLNKKSIAFLEKYLNNASPTGYESEGQKIWMDYLKPYVDTFITDNYGTAVGIINPDAKFKVVIEGHADEISWYVNYITPEGIYLCN